MIKFIPLIALLLCSCGVAEYVKANSTKGSKKEKGNEIEIEASEVIEVGLGDVVQNTGAIFTISAASVGRISAGFFTEREKVGSYAWGLFAEKPLFIDSELFEFDKKPSTPELVKSLVVKVDFGVRYTLPLKTTLEIKKVGIGSYPSDNGDSIYLLYGPILHSFTKGLNFGINNFYRPVEFDDIKLDISDPIAASEFENGQTTISGRLFQNNFYANIGYSFSKLTSTEMDVKSELVNTHVSRYVSIKFDADLLVLLYTNSESSQWEISNDYNEDFSMKDIAPRKNLGLSLRASMLVPKRNSIKFSAQLMCVPGYYPYFKDRVFLKMGIGVGIAKYTRAPSISVK